MDKLESDILIVGGGAAGMAAALAASAKQRLTIVDDNPRLGGQIWRAELGKLKSPQAAELISRIATGRINIVNNAQVFAASGHQTLIAEALAGTIEFEYEKLVLATGSRERFLPFPGWTVPNVCGAGGLQALVKGGLQIQDKRVVIAGSGPLLLVVAEYLKSKGANVLLIAEQTSSSKLNRFALGLWRYPSKIAQGIALKSKLLGVLHLTDCWVTNAECRSPHEVRAPDKQKEVDEPAGPLNSVTLQRKDKSWSIDCDYLACGFHLVPNTELASILGCKIKNGFVDVNEFQQTTVPNIFCVGEPTGIGGVEAALIEGEIAGLAAAGETEKARSLFRKRDKTSRFTKALDTTLSLRDELKTLAQSDTFVCRCEDVDYDRLAKFANWREAKLQTRCGMGPCQGRICRPATEFLFGWHPDGVRPPIFPVKLENL